MKRVPAGMLVAVLALPIGGLSLRADDSHHPAQGTAPTQSTPPSATSAALSELTIKALQEALSKQGIAVEVDGVLSDETRAAIRQYQSQHHLPVTGAPDKATLDKLGVASAQAAEPQRGQAQGGMMMNCPMMQGGQAAQGGMMNCPMTPSQAQPGAPGQSGQTQGMGPGMMHGGRMGPAQMQPGQMQPGHAQPGTK